MHSAPLITTIFEQRIENRTPTSAVGLVIGIIISLVIVIAGLILAGPLLIILIPLVVIVNIRIAQSQKPKHVGIFFETAFNNNVYYGYIDHRGERHSHQLIDEYTYWFYTDGMTMNGTKYVLVVMLRSKSEEIFLKEELILLSEPEGWGYEDQKVNEGTGVYHISNLPLLVAVLNQQNPEIEPVKAY